MSVAQQIIIPGAIQGGGSTNKRWWVFAGLIVACFFFTAVGVAMEPSMEELAQCDDAEFFTGEVSEECLDLREQEASSALVGGIGGLFCCSGIIVLIVASLAGKPAAKTVVVQQGFIPHAQAVQGRPQIIQISEHRIKGPRSEPERAALRLIANACMGRSITLGIIGRSSVFCHYGIFRLFFSGWRASMGVRNQTP